MYILQYWDGQWYLVCSFYKCSFSKQINEIAPPNVSVSDLLHLCPRFSSD